MQIANTPIRKKCIKDVYHFNEHIIRELCEGYFRVVLLKENSKYACFVYLKPTTHQSTRKLLTWQHTLNLESMLYYMISFFMV